MPAKIEVVLARMSAAELIGYNPAVEDPVVAVGTRVEYFDPAYDDDGPFHVETHLASTQAVPQAGFRYQRCGGGRRVVRRKRGGE